MPEELIDTVDFEIVFTEVTDDESGPYEPPVEPVFEPSLGMIFDFLFAGDADPVSVIGLLSAVIILGIVWSYRVFCFELY
jgi:ABC-type cobalt transport system substrate-binding protein